MTSPTPACDCAESLPIEIVAGLKQIEGIEDVKVRLPGSPAWKITRIIATGRLPLTATSLMRQITWRWKKQAEMAVFWAIFTWLSIFQSSSRLREKRDDIDVLPRYTTLRVWCAVMFRLRFSFFLLAGVSLWYLITKTIVVSRREVGNRPPSWAARMASNNQTEVPPEKRPSVGRANLISWLFKC